MPPADPTPEPLSVALLLATTGGMLDAFVYLNHGQVFANAMTGNVALIALGRNWLQALQHFVPICAFVAGVATSLFMGSGLIAAITVAPAAFASSNPSSRKESGTAPRGS
jgi:uncharacterized membrane protein YoaK (UPF0700 family)